MDHVSFVEMVNSTVLLVKPINLLVKLALLTSNLELKILNVFHLLAKTDKTTVIPAELIKMNVRLVLINSLLIPMKEIVIHVMLTVLTVQDQPLPVPLVNKMLLKNT